MVAAGIAVAGAAVGSFGPPTNRSARSVVVGDERGATVDVDAALPLLPLPSAASPLSPRPAFTSSNSVSNCGLRMTFGSMDAGEMREDAKAGKEDADLMMVVVVVEEEEDAMKEKAGD